MTPAEEFPVSKEQRDVAKTKAPQFTKPLSIQFATGDATLSASAKKLLSDEVIPILKTASNAVLRIEGNTDNVGNYDSNVALSQRRANAVVQYLVNRGYNADRLIPVGNGPSKKVASNDTAEGRQKNRRTDVMVISNQ